MSTYPNLDWTALQIPLGTWNRYWEIRAGQPSAPRPEKESQ